jgi:hypothetical protein
VYLEYTDVNNINKMEAVIFAINIWPLLFWKTHALEESITVLLIRTLITVSTAQKDTIWMKISQNVSKQLTVAILTIVMDHAILVMVFYKYQSVIELVFLI